MAAQAAARHHGQHGADGGEAGAGPKGQPPLGAYRSVGSSASAEALMHSEPSLVPQASDLNLGGLDAMQA